MIETLTPNRQPLPAYVKWTCIALLAVIAVLALDYASAFFIPLLIAVMLSFLLLPLSRRLERLRLPRAVAIVLTILLALSVVVGLVWLFGSQVAAFTKDWPRLHQQLNGKLQQLYALTEQKAHVGQDKQEAYLHQRTDEILQAGGKYLLGIFTTTATVLVMAALIPIYIFLLTYYREKWKRFLCDLAPGNKRGQVLGTAAEVSGVMQHYIRGVLIDISILGVLTSTGLMLLGIEHALFLGILAAILNIVPYVGVTVGSLLPMLVALVTKDSLWYAVGALGIGVCVQFIDNHFITPKVVGGSVNLNPLFALMSLFIGQLIWGVAGMILFIPLMGMVKVVCDHVPALNVIGEVMGERDVRRRAQKLASQDQGPGRTPVDKKAGRAHPSKKTSTRPEGKQV